MRRLFHFALLALIVIAAGCGEPEPEPEPEPVAPPPPTADELYQRLRQPLQPIWTAVESEQSIPRPQLDAIVQAFASARQQIAVEINAKEAMDRVRNDLTEIIPKTKREEKAKAAYVAVAAFKILEPGSNRYESVEIWANLFLNRPNVYVKGFITEGSTRHVFLEAKDPLTGDQQTFTVREGEEFYQRQNERPLFRIEEIVGEGSWVVINYLPLDQTFRLASPSELRRDPLGENRPL